MRTSKLEPPGLQKTQLMLQTDLVL